MEIKRTDTLRYTTTVQTAKQGEFTEDVAKFQRTQEKAKAKEQDDFEKVADNAIDDLLNPADNGFDFSDINLEPDILTHKPRPSTKEPKNSEPKRSITTAEINEEQNLLTDLTASNQKKFNTPPKIFSDANKKQSEFTDGVANFKEIEKQAEADAFRRTAESAIDDLLRNSSPIGTRISESETKSKTQNPVPTSESYAKQKLFTQLRAISKRTTNDEQ